MHSAEDPEFSWKHQTGFTLVSNATDPADSCARRGSCGPGLRRLEQPDRPRRFVGNPHSGRARAADRQSYASALRNVALSRLEPRQSGETQPVPEPVEERGDAACIIAGRVVGEADLLGRQRLDRKGGEDHVFDAETGIDSVEPFPEERREVVRITARTSGAEPYPLDAAVDAVEGEIEPPCSRSFLRQTLNQIGGEPLGRQHQIGGLGNRLGKTEPHAPARRFAERRQWLGHVVERLIEPLRDGLTETLRHRIARHRIKIADPLQADPPKPLGDGRIKPEGFHRQ